MDNVLNWNYIAVAMCMLLTTTKCSEVHGSEPRCSSLFVFEAKLLERTITAEVKMKQMQELLHNMEAAWKLQETEINRLKSDFQEQVAAGGGATYTRWGRTVCPGKATTIYAGIAAGSYYTHPGGPATVLCLPSDPIFGNYQGGKQGTYVYSVEYHGANTQYAETFGRTLNSQDVPCVVCEATGRRSKILVPARNLCYSGWHLEYSGYLMTSHHTHKRVEAVCVDDSDTEVVAGQSGTNYGELFYFIEAGGQIPDPPYIRGKEFTCAVCTK